MVGEIVPFLIKCAFSGFEKIIDSEHSCMLYMGRTRLVRHIGSHVVYGAY